MRQPGQQIRGYVLKERIGAGGMGEVWLVAKLGAHSFAKNLCIKTMLPEASAFLDYFATEARLGGRLAHSNLVNVFDFFEESGEHFIVMEYVEGLNLQSFLEKVTTLAPHVACYVAWSALKGLHFAHTAALGGPQRSGLVHRDVSPDNILISPDGEVKVTDFGVAQIGVEWRKKTQAENAFRGKPVYASPEMFRPATDAKGNSLPLDARADVYQVGAVLYQMLAGRPAFGAVSSIYELSVRVAEGRVTPLRELAPNVTPAVVTVVETMMHHDREQRYKSAQLARVALFQACPDLAMADQPLAEMVRLHTRAKRRHTSPYIRPEDLPHLNVEAPPMLGGGGVVLEGHAEAETMKVGIAALARAVKTPKLVDGAPAQRENAPRVPIVDGNSTDVLESFSRRSLRSAAAVAGMLAVLIAGGVVVTAVKLHAGAQRHSVVAAAPTALEPQPSPSAPSQPADAEKLAPPPSQEVVPRPPSIVAKPHQLRHDAPSPAASSGRIVVRREATPVRIYVDGAYVGKAPLKYEVDPGRHEVKLERADGPMELPVRVEAGHDYPVNAVSR